jgi:hypothetical protein
VYYFFYFYTSIFARNFQYRKITHIQYDIPKSAGINLKVLTILIENILKPKFCVVVKPIYIYIYIYICVCVCVYIYIHKYIQSKKGKVRNRTGNEGPVSSLSLNSALDRGEWLMPRPGRFTPAKESRYPLYRRLSGPQGQSGWVRIISPPPGFDPPTVQLVASRYTDCAIPAHIYIFIYVLAFKFVTIWAAIAQSV